MCTLGLNAEKVDLPAGAGAGDSTPEIGALTVTDPPSFGQSCETPAGAVALIVPANATSNIDTRCLNRGCLTTKRLRRVSRMTPSPVGTYDNRPHATAALLDGLVWRLPRSRDGGCLLRDGVGHPHIELTVLGVDRGDTQLCPVAIAPHRLR